MKYRLTDNTTTLYETELYQIQACQDIPAYNVHKGDLGGYIEDDDCLSQVLDAWVKGNAHVFKGAIIAGNAHVYGNAVILNDARVYGNAVISGDAQIFGLAQVYGSAQIGSGATIRGNAKIHGDIQIFTQADICGKADIEMFNNYLTVSPMGSWRGYATFFRTSSKEIYAISDRIEGDIKTFEDLIYNKYRYNIHGNAYRAAIAMAKEIIGKGGY